MWVAYFQADGEIRHRVAVGKFRGAVEAALERFISRMTNPEVGLWFTWVEKYNANSPDVRSSYDDI